MDYLVILLLLFAIGVLICLIYFLHKKFSSNSLFPIISILLSICILLFGTGIVKDLIFTNTNDLKATISSSYVAKGDTLKIEGTAEGTNKGVAIWIFGPKKLIYVGKSVNSDNSFDYDITNEMTKNFDIGRYLVIIQHPMNNHEFDLYPNNPALPLNILSSYPNPGSLLFKTDGPDSLYGTNASDAFINAILFVDDSYTQLNFLVEEPGITIDLIGEQKRGSKIEITGTTNLMYDENYLLIEVCTPSSNPPDISRNVELCEVTGTVKVEPDRDGLNKWRFNVDTSTFKPGNYIVRVSCSSPGAVADEMFSIV